MTLVLSRDFRRTPRRTLLALAIKRRGGWLLLGLAILASGLALAMTPWTMHVRGNRVLEDGTRTTAQIIDVNQFWTKHVSRTGGFTYAFEVGPDRFEGRAYNTESSIWQDLEVGDTVTVAYDPYDPATSIPVRNDLDRGQVRSVPSAAFISMIGVVIAAVGGLILWGLLVRLPGRWAHLLRRGKMAVGRVDHVEVRPATRARTQLRYSYDDRFGQATRSETEWAPSPETTWRAGDEGLVLYDSDDPSSSVWVGPGDLTFYR